MSSVTHGKTLLPTKQLTFFRPSPIRSILCEDASSLKHSPFSIGKHMKERQCCMFQIVNNMESNPSKLPLDFGVMLSSAHKPPQKSSLIIPPNHIPAYYHLLWPWITTVPAAHQSPQQREEINVGQAVCLCHFVISDIYNPYPKQPTSNVRHGNGNFHCESNCR